MKRIRKIDVTRTLLDAAIEVASLARSAGGRAYIVGGAVRDNLLGIQAKDIDMEIFGIEAPRLVRLLAERFPLDLVGMSFGVVKLKGLEIDITVPRLESKTGLGHKAFEILSKPGLSVEEAAKRRDFTVNAVYLDPLTLETIDPAGGIRDLECGILRHVSNLFADDPLRVLRAMQFIARFGLSPAAETIAVCRTMSHETLPKERIFGEWSKLLAKGKDISKGLEFLRATGWVSHYPELAALIGCRQDPKWHPEGDVWRHTLLAMDAFAKKRTGIPHEDIVVGLAVLCHDFGKPLSSTEEGGHIRSCGHDAMGLSPTESFLKRLTNEERILEEVPPLVANHMAPYGLWQAKSSDSAIRRLSLRVGRIDRLLRLCRADSEGRHPLRPDCEPFDWLEKAAERLSVAAKKPVPLLMGRDLVALGLEPSPAFGKLINESFEAQIEGCFSDREGAVARFMKQHPELIQNGHRQNRTSRIP